MEEKKLTIRWSPEYWDRQIEAMWAEGNVKKGGWIPVVSSFLVAYRCGEAAREFGLKFKGGRAYRYYDVPPYVVEMFLASPSLGRAYNALFRDKYQSVTL